MEIFPLIEDEYDYEISRILEEIQNKSINKEELGNIIHRIFKDSFRAKFDKSVDACVDIARKILIN